MSNFTKSDSKNENLLNYLTKALMELITANEDTLDLKTETNEPKELALMEEWGNYAKSQNLEKESGLISRFLIKYKRLMFSLDRKSRTEIVESFKAFIQRELQKLNNNSSDSLLNEIKK